MSQPQVSLCDVQVGSDSLSFRNLLLLFQCYPVVCGRRDRHERNIITDVPTSWRVQVPQDSFRHPDLIPIFASSVVHVGACALSEPRTYPMLLPRPLTEVAHQLGQIHRYRFEI